MFIKKKTRFTVGTKTSRTEAFKNEIKNVIERGKNSNKKRRRHRGRSNTEKSKISNSNRQRLYNICLKFKSVYLFAIYPKKQTRNQIHKLDEYLFLEQILLDFKRKIKPFVRRKLKNGFLKIFEYSIKLGEFQLKIKKSEELITKLNKRIFFWNIKRSFREKVIISLIHNSIETKRKKDSAFSLFTWKENFQTS